MKCWEASLLDHTVKRAGTSELATQQSHFRRMHANVKIRWNLKPISCPSHAVRRIKIQQRCLSGVSIFGWLFRADFVRGLGEGSSQVLISVDSYWKVLIDLWNLWSLRWRDRISQWRDAMWKLPSSQGLPVSQKHNTIFHDHNSRLSNQRALFLLVRKPKVMSAYLPSSGWC